MSFECALNPATAGQGLGVPDYFALASRQGYRWVELDSAQARSLPELGSRAARQLLDRHALQVASFFLPVAWRADEEAFQRDLRQLPRLSEIAAGLGATRCCTWLAPNLPTPPDESRRWVGDRFGRIASVLAGHGLRFGLEFIGPAHFRQETGFTFLYRMEDMLAFAVELGPNVGILVDSLHWHCLGSDRGALASLPVERLVYAHIDDAPDVPRAEQRDDDRLLPGDGAIDLCGFLAGLAEAGYDGPIGIEIDGPALQHLAADEAARRARLAWVKVLSDCGRAPRPSHRIVDSPPASR